MISHVLCKAMICVVVVVVVVNGALCRVSPVTHSILPAPFAGPRVSISSLVGGVMYDGGLIH